MLLPDSSILNIHKSFEPNDHQLMVYLSNKANGEQLPSDDLITEIDLYHIVDPGELFRNIDSEENTLYVFTKVEKVSPNGTNVNRKVFQNLYWKGVDGEKRILNEAGCSVGKKRKFRFMDKNNTKMNLGYGMTEYVLDEKSLEKTKFKDYVVCRIKRYPKKVGGSIGIHGEREFGFRKNSPVNVLAPTTPFDSTALAASSTAASDSPINNLKMFLQEYLIFKRTALLSIVVN